MGTGSKDLVSALVNRCSIICLAIAVGLAGMNVIASPAYAQSTPQGYTFEECNDVDVEVLRDEINALAFTVLADGSRNIDVQTLVDRKWRDLQIDAVLDDEVERAVQAIQQRETYWNRLLSGWWSARAEGYASVIANDAFGSEKFQAAIDRLATEVAAEIAAEIESVSALSASTALLCMQAYVGERYSASLFDLFQNEVRAGVEAIDIEAETDIELSAINVHSKALGGIGVIIVTQIARRIGQTLGKKVAERIAGKIVGRVLGRLGSSMIPVAGWVIGAGLIVWDLIEGGKGAFPQIQEALQSEEVKAGIRAEIAAAVGDGLAEELDDIAGHITLELVDEWQGFCKRHPHLCELPTENEQFKSILGVTSLEQIDKLSALVNLYMDALDRNALDRSIESGSFEHLLAVPQGTYAILRDTGSEETALAWSAAAGPLIGKVARYEVFRYREPHELDPDTLAALVGLGNRAAIARLLQLEDEKVALLATLPMAELLVLSTSLLVDDLDWLADYAAQPDSLPLAVLGADLASGATTVLQYRQRELEIPVVVAPGIDVVQADETGVLSEPLTEPFYLQYWRMIGVGLLLIFLALLLFGVVWNGVVKR